MTRAPLLILAALLMATSAMAQHLHSDVRQFVIKSQLSQAGDDAVVFIGDSITEDALLPSEICGHHIVNAGVGGLTPKAYLDTIIRGIPRFRASEIIIDLGTNDAVMGYSPLQFEERYSDLLTIVREYSDHISLAGIPPIEPDHALDSVAADAINEQIRQIAQKNDLHFIDVRTEDRPVTVDGIHPSAESYTVWIETMLHAIHSDLAC